MTLGAAGANGRHPVAESLRQALEQLTAAGVPDPAADLAALAAHHGLVRGTTVPAEFEVSVARRVSREPLPLIVGTVSFAGMTLLARRGVFLPRAQSEVVVAAVRAELLGRSGNLVVDLCAGGGALALAIARETPSAAVHGVDVGPEPIALAVENNRRLGNPVRSFAVADATAEATLTEFDGRVDLVVANPPYIPPDGVPREQEVREHEPALALYGGGPDGLLVAGGVVRTAARLLRPGGLIVLEHSDLQAERMRSVVHRAGGFDPAVTHQDLAGADRFLTARRARDSGPTVIA